MSLDCGMNFSTLADLEKRQLEVDQWVNAIAAMAYYRRAHLGIVL
jgi:hypothetical protein